jgi:hypothetical protein
MRLSAGVHETGSTPLSSGVRRRGSEGPSRATPVIRSGPVATIEHGDFEWDDAKAAANEKKHGVTFVEAATVFDDVDVLRALLEASDHVRRTG